MDPTTIRPCGYGQANAGVFGNGSTKLTTIVYSSRLWISRPEDRSSFCKVVEQDRKEDDNQLSSDSDTEPRAKEVYKIHHPAAGQQRGRYRGTSRYSSLTCFTCGKKGHGYAACPDRTNVTKKDTTGPTVLVQIGNRHEILSVEEGTT